MELLLIIAGLVLLDVLAVRFGVDSRGLAEDARRDWWPAAPMPPSPHPPQDIVEVYRAERLHEAALSNLVGQALAGRPPRSSSSSVRGSTPSSRRTRLVPRPARCPQ